jgi:HSP20 family protein
MVPFKKSQSLSKRGDYFNHFLDSFFDEDYFAPLSQFGSPFRVDLKETSDSYQIEADLPGIPKEAITLEYADRYLTISAKREDAVEKSNNDYVRRERKFGQFQRSFYIDNVDESQICAEFKEGVLFVTLPKQDKDLRTGHSIPIK